MVSDGPGLFTIELNERVYTIKARSRDEAKFWVDALQWRQAGGVVTQKSPDKSKEKVGDRQFENGHSSTASPTKKSMHVVTAVQPDVDVTAGNLDDVGKDGAPCAACCVIC